MPAHTLQFLMRIASKLPGDQNEPININVLSLSKTKTITVRIEKNESESPEIDISGYRWIFLHMPSSWTTADISLLGAHESGGTFDPVYGADAIEIVISAAASRLICIDTYAYALAPLSFIKLRSGTAATPVLQSAVRLIVLGLTA